VTQLFLLLPEILGQNILKMQLPDIKRKCLHKPDCVLLPPGTRCSSVIELSIPTVVLMMYKIREEYFHGLSEVVPCGAHTNKIPSALGKCLKP
jgi:hypothetical protein